MKMDYARGYRANTADREARVALCDVWLFRSTLLLLSIGLVMVASSSMSVAEKMMHDPFYFVERQIMFMMAGLLFGWIVYRTPVLVWYRAAPVLLLISFLLLGLVLAVGTPVNGSKRWIALGFFNLQVSEIAKLAVLAYLASYLVRHAQDARDTLAGFIKPMSVVLIFSILLLAEPDLGNAMILIAVSLVVMYLAGVRFKVFMMIVAVMLVLFALSVWLVPYQQARIEALLNPWAHQSGKGYQLVNSLMALGLGGFSGVGLGSSIQKLFYLPEPHTDFIYAVIGEEMGLIGTTLVMVLYVILVLRTFSIASRAMRRDWIYHAYFAYGIGILIGIQAFVNMGVNMGVLPTKGLTLPLMSYGGSNLIMTMIAIAVLFRIDYELRTKENLRRPRKRQ